MKASKFSPVIDQRFRYRAEDAVNTLKRDCRTIGHPRDIRFGQGREFVSRGLDLWAFAHGVTPDFSWPAKPAVNAFPEAFNASQAEDARTRIGS